MRGDRRGPTQTRGEIAGAIADGYIGSATVKLSRATVHRDLVATGELDALTARRKLEEATRLMEEASVEATVAIAAALRAGAPDATAPRRAEDPPAEAAPSANPGAWS